MSQSNMMVSPFAQQQTTIHGFACDDKSSTVSSADNSSSSSPTNSGRPCVRRLRSLLSAHLQSELGHECSSSDADDDHHDSAEIITHEAEDLVSQPSSGRDDGREPNTCTSQPIEIPLLSYFKCPKLLAGRANLQYQRQVYRQQLEAREAFLQTQAK
ncbi:MAG: hypothetical protein WDW38_002258 [Sanguina aurantia]